MECTNYFGMYILFWDVHIILDLYIWDVIMYKIIWDSPKVFWAACILLRLFTMRLPNISDQAKNGLFIAFSRSNSFGVLEHNALLDALAHPVKGLNLFEYDELGFDLINNAKIQ